MRSCTTMPKCHRRNNGSAGSRVKQFILSTIIQTEAMDDLTQTKLQEKFREIQAKIELAVCIVTK